MPTMWTFIKTNSTGGRMKKDYRSRKIAVRTNFMTPERKDDRARLFLQLSEILFEKNQAVFIEDRQFVCGLLLKKLNEEYQEKKP
jgi:hypothetical protein